MSLSVGGSQNGLALVGTLTALLAFAMPVRAAPPPPGFKSSLATPQQDAAEQLVLKILADPRVVAAKERARKLLEASPIAHLPDGRARLEHTLQAWLTFLTFQEANADPDRPAAIWSCNTAEYTWFGHTMPAAGASVDNPDNIYRHIPIDGAARYEIRGQLRPMHPAQFTFQLLRADNLIPVGNDNKSLGMLGSRDMVIAPDGSFTVTLDPDPANGRPNHIQTHPGPLLRLLFRDTVTDWKQNPNELTITRVGGPPMHPAPDVSALAARVAEQLPAWVSGWLGYVEKWVGPPPDNTLVPPYGRSGAWGYISPVRFHLADDDAMVITVDDAGAEYAAIQVTDIWTIAPDPQNHLSSYTMAQAHRNADGTITYVVAPRDPGTANWVDTAGWHQGWVGMRWQGVPYARTSGDGLVRDFKVVKVKELAALLPAEMRGVTPEQRREELRVRRDEWRLRIATGK